MIEFLPGIRSTIAALQAERVRMDVIGQNIANAHLTRGPDGQPYVRRQVVFETVLRQQTDPAQPPIPEVRVTRILKDSRPLPLVYKPGHPDADRTGMVRMPNVNIHEEMADLIASSRAYEANLAVLRNARALAQQTLNIGKRL
ncbi:MAG: flagellar basal body rod protein FlgC [Verrucomicrobiae bacterium]|nr:flagellar basal body rod protein FlgC [Verrucomicrobiae bacterium]